MSARYPDGVAVNVSGARLQHWFVREDGHFARLERELKETTQTLQSTVEELETSQEEQQSLNEELGLKVDEIREADDDMQNLLDSTGIAIVFLDSQLNIKRYMEPARALINFIASDIGRPFSDLVHQLRYSCLMDDCRAVLETRARKEVEVQTTQEVWHRMRMMACRTVDNAVEGLVLTFANIDPIKRAQRTPLRSRPGP